MTPKTEIDSFQAASSQNPEGSEVKDESIDAHSSDQLAGASPISSRAQRSNPSENEKNPSSDELATIAEGHTSSLIRIEELDPRRRFAMKEKIGQGGFAEVWGAEQIPLWRQVAIKKLRPSDRSGKGSKSTDSTPQERAFRLEALVTANLEHPNIMPIYDMGYDEEDGRPLMAMKLIRGLRWDELLNADRERMTIPDLLNKHLPILIDISQALAFAHSRGIVHRDIKPSQVMLGDYGEVLLTDWGLALGYDEELVAETASPELAKAIPNGKTAANPAGTPAFMAPEQTTKTAEEICPQTDIFMLGACLYFMMTGRPPYDATDPRKAIVQAARRDVKNPRDVVSKGLLPQEPVSICMKAMLR